MTSGKMRTNFDLGKLKVSAADAFVVNAAKKAVTA